MSTIRDELLAIRVELEGAKKASEESLTLAKSQDKVAKSATGIGKSAVESEKKASRFSKTLSYMGKVARWGATGLLAGGAAVALWGKKAVSSTVELAKATSGLQKTFGLTTGTASAFLSLAKVRGADYDKTAMFVKSFATNLRSAATGSTSAIGMFRKLGFSQKDIQKGLKDSDGALFKAADGFEHLEGGLAKGAIASKLFGKGYSKIFPLLREGSKAFKEHIAEAKSYGAVLHGSAIDSSLEFAEAQRKVELAMIGLQITFTEKVLPSLIKVMLWFGKLTNEFRQGRGPIHDVLEAVRPFAETLLHLGQGLVQDKTLLTAFLIGLAAFKVATTAAAVAMDLFDVALWANPIGLVVLGLVALGIAFFVAYHKIKWFHEAIDAVFGFVKDHWRVLIIPFAPIIGSIAIIVANLGHLKDAWGWIKTAVSDVINFMENSTLGKVLTAPLRGAIFAVEKLIEGYEAVSGVISSLEGEPGPEVKADPRRLRQEEKSHPPPDPGGSHITNPGHGLGVPTIKPRRNWGKGKGRFHSGSSGAAGVRGRVQHIHLEVDGKTLAEVVRFHNEEAEAFG